jgi:hypothetical protein
MAHMSRAVSGPRGRGNNTASHSDLSTRVGFARVFNYLLTRSDGEKLRGTGYRFDR